MCYNVKCFLKEGKEDDEGKEGDCYWVVEVEKPPTEWFNIVRCPWVIVAAGPGKLSPGKLSG